MDVWDDVNAYHRLMLRQERRRGPMIELYPHQKKAVEELDNGKILWGGVGSGKSLTSLAYFFTRECGGVLGDSGSMTAPKDLYIITTAKKRDSLDWQGDAAKLGLSRERAASVSGIQVTVDSWNNIEKYREVENAFFIFDEQRLVGSGAWTKAFIHLAKHNRWVLLSATPGDTWLDYIPVFVANGFYKNRTAFKREHVVYNTFSKFPKVDHYVSVGKLVKYRNQILVHMPYLKHTTRHIQEVPVQHDPDLFEAVTKKRWHVYEDRPIKDVGELFIVMRKVANSDFSRIVAIKRLLKKHPKLIVFYNFDYELDLLRHLGKELETSLNSSRKNSTSSSAIGNATTSRITSPSSGKRSSRKLSVSETATTALTADGMDLIQNHSLLAKDVTAPAATFATAEWNGHKHQPIPDTDSWLYLVQYTAGAEGWNCVETDAMAFYSLTYSYKIFEQAMGRIDRLNTPYSDLYYHVLTSKSLIDQAIKKALAGKESFNERDFGSHLIQEARM